MSDAVLLAIIASIPATLSAIFGFMNNMLARRTEKHAEKTSSSISNLVEQTNGLKDALVNKTEHEAYTRGVTDEKKRGEDIMAAVKANQSPPVVILHPTALTEPPLMRDIAGLKDAIKNKEKEEEKGKGEK